MDLRIQKTLETIEQEFLELREKTPLNKIKINELCVNAKINKSTFYRHYTDVFDLSDKIENKSIHMVMQDFTAIDSLFTNPEEFVGGLLTSIQKHNKEILVLFGDRLNVFTQKIEERLKSRYLAYSDSPEKDTLMLFLIGGATHVFLDTKYSIQTYTKTVAALLRKISPVISDW